MTKATHRIFRETERWLPD